jgi:type IV pilus assembly protein PilB
MSIPIPLEQLKKRLIEENLVTEEQFNALALEAASKNQNIIEVLASDRDIDINYLNDIIAHFLGVERINFAVHPIQEDLLRSLPEEIARQRQVIIFTKEADGSLGVAMADPSDLETIKFLQQNLKTRIKPYLATTADLNRGFSVYGLQTAEDFKQKIEDNIQASLKSGAKSAEEAAAALPIVALVENLLSYALSLRASDIHIEALEEATMVRYRVDGLLKEIMRIPRNVHPALIARIKLLSGLKIDEHYKPQDGRFRFQTGAQIVDIRVSILPTYHGEKIVMRLLESSQKPLSLEELGFLPDVAKAVAEDLKRVFGMILVCGPTGSGKSTTLYGLVNIINHPNVNIVTVEDPIEYNMRYVNQSQVNAQAGITFASGLRSILRQDPNVIMVGEIRDNETADIAVQAALTGHLILSTIHTNDAPTSVVRLFDMGVPPFLVSSVLNVIIAQRLVRKICTSCIHSRPVDEALGKAILDQFRGLDLPLPEKLPTILYEGKGCSVCNGTGYRGRMGIFEVLEVKEKIKTLIAAPRFDLHALSSAARASGMKTMYEDGIEKAELGLTNIEEVLRVIRE